MGKGAYCDPPFKAMKRWLGRSNVTGGTDLLGRRSLRGLRSRSIVFQCLNTEMQE